MKHFLFTAVILGAAIITPAFAQDAKNPRVVMETSAGKIVIELYADKSPATVKNFLQYVEDKHYDGTIFHRVIADFMIQGGGFEPGLKEKKTRDPVKNEAGNGVKNERGTIAMARTPDPDSATAQFFINAVDNERLDRANASDKFGYAVFGKVVEGLDVVDRIRRVEIGVQFGSKNVPTKDVLIKSVRVLKK
jgi:peptidyl-prolyl cis-trans isomerase A (cyclophilin A)